MTVVIFASFGYHKYSYLFLSTGISKNSVQNEVDEVDVGLAIEIRGLEQKLLQSDFRRNRAAVAELLADDFRELGSSGRAWNKQQVLDHLETGPPFEAMLQDFQTKEVAAGVVLATYKLTIRRTGAEAAHSLRSSLWIKRDNRWELLFHQGTNSA